MTLPAICNPFPIFMNLAGGGLNGGDLYIGEPGLDPETNPKAVFWDAEGTISAEQPLSTMGGMILRSGTPAEAFTDGAYSIRVIDRLGVQVFYEQTVKSFANFDLSNVAPIAGRVDLAAAPTSRGTVYLTEGGRSGSFTWSATNLSAQVASDPAQGIYVAPLTHPTGASGAWVRDRANDGLNPRWFGALANGGSNPISGLFANLAAAQVFYPFATALTNEIDHLAITAAKNFGLVVSLGAGSFYVDRAISLSAYEAIIGAGRYQTFITTTSATANVIDVDGYYTKISGIAFRSSVTRTAGYAVSYNSGSANGNLLDFNIGSFFQGIFIDAIAGINLTDGEVIDTLSGGVSIRVANGFALYVRGVGMSTNPAARCFAHFVLSHVADMTLDYVQALYAQAAIYMNPIAGKEIDSLTVSNSFFDQSQNNALVFTGAGKFQRSSFQNTWFCGGTNACVEIDTTAAGESTGVKFTTCIFVPGPSGTNIGINLKGANTKNTTLNNCSISWVNNGAVYDTCTGGLVIQGCRIGNTDGFTGCVNGIVITGTCDNYVIVGNDLRGNTTAAISGHVASATKIADLNLV